MQKDEVYPNHTDIDFPWYLSYAHSFDRDKLINKIHLSSGDIPLKLRFKYIDLMKRET